MVYKSDKIASYMMKLVAKFGCVSDMLNIAMYYYKTCKYNDALFWIDITKVNFAKPFP